MLKGKPFKEGVQDGLVCKFPAFDVLSSIKFFLTEAGLCLGLEFIVARCRPSVARCRFGSQWESY